MIQHNAPTGNEQGGSHPAIVVAVHEHSQLCTVIPLTSNGMANRFSFTHQIQRSDINRLNNDSVAMIFQITCIDWIKFQRKIGLLEQTHHHQICIKMKQFFGL